MYVLCSKITIGRNTFGGINEVEIMRSINEPCATAKIKVPETAVQIVDGIIYQQKKHIDIVKEVKPGDQVYIQLGYNGVYYHEFKGYVKQIDYRSPLVIECEDEFYTTRERYISISGKSENEKNEETAGEKDKDEENTPKGNVVKVNDEENSSEEKETEKEEKVPEQKITLSEILEVCGLKIGYAAPLTIKLFMVDNKSVSWLIHKLKQEYGLKIFFDLDGRVYAGNIFTMIEKFRKSNNTKNIGETVKYEYRYNIIKDEDLKIKEPKDLKVTVISKKNDGETIMEPQKKENEENDTNTKIYHYDIEDRETLKEILKNEEDRLNAEGYEGNFEAFLQPYAAPGMVAQLIDNVFEVRAGEYLIEKVTTKFGITGGRRTIVIGGRL